MKNFTPFWIFLIGFMGVSVNAQVKYEGLDKDYTQSMDSLLTYVDKSRVNTGILYDRVFTFIHLETEQDSIVSNYEHFMQSWHELYKASYNPDFSDIERLKTSITTSDKVYFGIINTNINYIDYGTDSLPSLAFSEGYFKNIEGIDPIREKQVTVIAPLRQKVFSDNVIFRLNPDFILQKSGIPIKDIEVDFGNGMSHQLITKSVVSENEIVVRYDRTGTKEIVFKVTYADNRIRFFFGHIDIILSDFLENSNTLYPLEENFVGTNGITQNNPENVAFQGYNDSFPSKNSLEYRTYYNLITNDGSEQSKIVKPIIILDGFDPGDKRKIYQGSAGYNPDDKSIYELMEYDHDNNPNTQSLNLVEKLRSAPYGFDVTLVNFPKGADYIERNAMALVALLQREKQKLAQNGSTEEIIIVGPSMGGLISRYALAYMEKNNIPHNTKLWVSFDSPHLGANIPVAAQENLYFFGYNGNQVQAKEKFDENFRSPAARQMLIEQLDGLHEEAPYSTLWNNSINGQNNNTPFRQFFISNLTTNGVSGSLGYPQNVRKITILNGTTNGIKTNSEGQLFLELAAFKVIKYGQIFGTPIQTKIKVVVIKDRFLAPYQLKSFEGSLSSPGGGLIGISTLSGSVTRTNTNPKGVMDIVQGGIFNTQGIIKDEFTSVLNSNSNVNRQEWRAYKPNHSFIPTVSALAFKNPNFNWSSPLDRNLVCDPNNKEIYFDSYFAPSKNEEHVFLTTEKVNWLLKEFVGNEQTPHFPINRNALSGPNFICIDENVMFSFDDICKIPSSVVQWTYSPNLQLINSGDYEVVVKGINNGEGIITAIFQNGQSLTKRFWVDKPYISGGTPNPSEPAEFTYYIENNCFDEPMTLCLGGNNFENKKTICVLGLDSSSQWEVVKISGNFTWSRSENIIYFNPIMQGQISFKVRVSNSCGWSNWVTYVMNVVNCSNQNNMFFKIYPNPSNNIVNLNLKDENYIPQNSTITGEIFDYQGFSKGNVQIINNEAVINVNNLAKGIYILRINIDGNIESHQIMVN